MIETNTPVTIASLLSDRAELEERYCEREAAASARISELINLIAELADPHPCGDRDHGYCRVHMQSTIEDGCPHARAAALLAFSGGWRTTAAEMSSDA